MKLIQHLWKLRLPVSKIRDFILPSFKSIKQKETGTKLETLYWFQLQQSDLTEDNVKQNIPNQAIIVVKKRSYHLFN